MIKIGRIQYLLFFSIFVDQTLKVQIRIKIWYYIFLLKKDKYEFHEQFFHKRWVLTIFFKRKFKHWWSTISPISTKQTFTNH